MPKLTDIVTSLLLCNFYMELEEIKHMLGISK